MTFGEKLKKIRTDKGLSQDELAEILGTSKQVISRYETNQRVPKVTVVSDYAQKLNVSLTYLLNNNEVDEPIDIPPNFPARLRYLREQKGETQEQLAEAMGYDLEDITKWEAGENRPEFKEFSELTRYFETNLDFLLGRDGQKSKTVVYHHGAAREIKGAEQPLSQKHRE